MKVPPLVHAFGLMIALFLAACGFEPVYAPGGTGSALFEKVEVSAPTTVDSFLLVQALEQRLGRTSSPEYDLVLDLQTTSQGQAVTADNSTTRYAIVGDLGYVLKRVDNAEIMASGTVRNFTGYSATGSTVETLAGERDARERLMIILADDLTDRLYATLDPGT